MHITGYQCFIVPPRWVFLKVETSEGIVGWGEPSLEGKARSVKVTTEEYMETLIGKNPLEIERHWQDIYRGGFYRGGPIMMSALSGIDQALWDIKGKYHNATVADLIGGCVRNKMRIYSWIGGDRPQDTATAAIERMEQGFNAVKMNATSEMQYIDKHSKVDEVLARVDAIRSATNEDFGIGIDFHGRIHKPMARILAKELEVYNPMFIEEPVLSENWEEFTEIRRHCNIPIATGERLYSRYDFKHILQSGAVDIIQPDLSHAGGISETLRIAAMAEAYDVALAPHCPLGPIALASCLQVDANRYNAIIQEQSLGIHYNQGCDILDYIKDKSVFDYKDGYINVLKKPGLGIDIDEDIVIKNSQIEHNWKNPIWRHEDGSFAEW
ncbi:MAG: galactonate dehydratase [Alphaproteobacteria bacterium]